MEIHLDSEIGSDNPAADRILRSILLAVEVLLQNGVKDKDTGFHKIKPEDLIVMVVTNMLVNFYFLPTTRISSGDLLNGVCMAFIECCEMKMDKDFENGIKH